ncbi:MAG: hypothetical protein ABI647_24005 [Gemmatimonadota bacterium]
MKSLREPLSDGVWAVSLWARDRTPIFCGLTASGAGLNQMGELVRKAWLDLASAYPGIILDEFVVLPDRLRAVLHVPSNLKAGAIGRIVGRLKNTFARAAHAAGLTGRAPLLETGFEGFLLKGPEELAFWRRMIRAGAGFGAKN